jgi:hypothetical protein
MSLNNIFKVMKTDGLVVKPLEKYLLGLNTLDNDRAINVNAPSQLGGCCRSNFYSRMKYPRDCLIDPRTRRIFNNGDYVHIRLQQYLEGAGLLLMREVPLIDTELNIQGHTDGFLNLDKVKNAHKIKDLKILEIKSINDNAFSKLKDAKEEHKIQGTTYLYCTERRRQYLRTKYKSEEEFKKSSLHRMIRFKNRFSYLKGGHKHTKAEKITLQVKLCLKADNILFHTVNPITDVVFLYEDKNNQELKEFLVSRNEETVDYIKNYAKKLNAYCNNKELPPREGTSKSCNDCRWCNYRNTCWVV